LTDESSIGVMGFGSETRTRRKTKGQAGVGGRGGRWLGRRESVGRKTTFDGSTTSYMLSIHEMDGRFIRGMRVHRRTDGSVIGGGG
jgi:hypothetical protein